MKQTHKEMENIKESLINMEDRVRSNIGLYVVFERDYREIEKHYKDLRNVKCSEPVKNPMTQV